MLKVVVNNKGIDVASPFVRDVADSVSKLIGIDANQDGNVSLGEGLAVGQDLIFKVMKHYANVQEAIAQLGDANSEERKELIAVFIEGFDLANDKVEQAVEKVIAYLERTITDGVKLYEEVRSLFVKDAA